MEVRTFSNAGRPGVGMRPKREAQRPLLPQHARHCPVLESGSALGYMVYPPLEPNEAVHVGYEGEGKYTCTFFLAQPGGKWDKIFTVAFQLAVGGLGAVTEHVEFRKPKLTDENAVNMAKAFLVPEDLGTPPGAVSLVGATNFQTPEGWDTVYTPIFNMIERPIAPMLIIRVETDWFAHATEFRYVLQPGEGMSLGHSLPIGQVVFVPREEIALVEGTEAERTAFQQSVSTFFLKKGEQKMTTAYGLSYSPHYLRESRRVRDEADARAGNAPASRPGGDE
ncbi:MAG TPA: hypothetical protein VMW48_02350 [Vicinamibacterales bacterium]|nr:hypothetical protein [Vicinamibacterales bacterium]